MYAPPPAPGKKNNTLSIVLISVSAVCILLCGVGGFMTYRGVQEVGSTVGPMLACTADLEMVRDGLVAYRDKNGKYPAAATWMADIRPLLKDTGDLKEMENNPVMKVVLMDRSKAFGCKATPEKTYAYAFNLAYAGKTTEEAAKITDTVLVFEADQEPKENLALPYKTPTGEALPRIMGQKRSWLVANVTGEVDFDAGSASGSASSQPK